MFSAITSLLQPLVNSAAEGTLPLQVAHCQFSELEFSGQAGDAVELPTLKYLIPGVPSLQHPHDVSVEDGEPSQLGGFVYQNMKQVILPIGYSDVGAACAYWQINNALDIHFKRSQSLTGNSKFSNEFILQPSMNKSFLDLNNSVDKPAGEFPAALSARALPDEPHRDTGDSSQLGPSGRPYERTGRDGDWREANQGHWR